MSKRIVSAPLSRVERIGIVFGGGRSMSQIKAASGCDWIINGGLYDFGTGKPVSHLKAGGKVYAKEDWGAWGYAWDAGPDIIMTPVPADRKANYLACLALLTPWDGINAKLTYDKAALGGTRGRSAIAVGGGKLTLYCTGDGTADGKTPEGLRAELHDLGVETALMLDSGGSSQCDFGGGQSIYSSRRVNNYLCVWLKKDSQDGKEDKPVDGITQAIMTSSDCYKAGRTITPKGIMAHSTATPGADAQTIRDAWNRAGAEAAVHYIIDDQHTLQTLPDTCRGWHCGAAANNTHIAFELCEPAECRLLPIEWVALKRGSAGWAVKRLQMELQARGFDPNGVDGSFGPGCETALKACQKSLGLTADGSCGPATLAKLAGRTGSYLAYSPQDTADYFNAAYARAVALCAGLCKKYGLDPDKNILCHSEGYKAGIASNHADVMHWFPEHGRTMDDFRADVKAALAGTAVPDALSEAVDKLAKAGIIGSPDYWKGGDYSADNVKALIVKMAAGI